MVYLQLFLSFFKVGSLAIGGAYSFLPLIEKEVVEKYGWLTKDEFLDYLGMVETFPGAISIKFATLTGYKIAGLPGAIVANLGNLITPALLIILAVTLYSKYKNLPQAKSALSAVKLAVFAMLIAVAFKSINLNQLLSLSNLLFVIFALLIFLYTKIHPGLIIILAAIFGAFLK